MHSRYRAPRWASGRWVASSRSCRGQGRLRGSPSGEARAMEGPAAPRYPACCARCASCRRPHLLALQLLPAGRPQVAAAAPLPPPLALALLPLALLPGPLPAHPPPPRAQARRAGPSRAATRGGRGGPGAAPLQALFAPAHPPGDTAWAGGWVQGRSVRQAPTSAVTPEPSSGGAGALRRGSSPVRAEVHAALVAQAAHPAVDHG